MFFLSTNANEFGLWRKKRKKKETRGNGTLSVGCVSTSEAVALCLWDESQEL